MMANLLAPGPSNPRMSEFLPNVKCSTCGKPVALSELGDHVCAAPPPVPSLPKPSTTPSQATALLPQRLQNLVAPPRINTSGLPAGGPASARPAARDPYTPGAFVPPYADPRNRSRSASNGPAANRQPLPDPRQYQIPPPPQQEVDGAAGMAGVGRRGFAAVARAAMFTAPPQGPRDPPPRMMMDDPASRVTPPLSPGSSYSSHSPGVSPYPPSPVQTTARPRSRSPGRNRLPDKPQLDPYGARKPPFPSRQSPPREWDNSPITATPRTGRPFREIVDSSRPKEVSRPLPPPRKHAKTPSVSSGSEYGGLAYADSEEEQEQDRALKTKAQPPPPLSLGGSILRNGRNQTKPTRPTINVPVNTRGNLSDGDDGAKTSSLSIAQAFGLRTPTTGQAGPGGSGIPPRSGRSTGSGSSYSRETSGSSGNALSPPGRMERAMGSLLEQQESRHKRSGSRTSNTRRSLERRGYDDDDHMSTTSSKRGLGASTMTGSGKTHRSTGSSSPETKPVKFTSRARTEKAASPEDVHSEEKRQAKKYRLCIRCEVKIEDGRWVSVDSGGVLCEKCWKNMYLPKCRRCSLPIEKQAVSSSDGQLKGKYHKDCFNCATCHEPFPDKTFYVFDGKPLCAYHYHEKNDSLCASERCGEPIEGPCAVSHTGDRYHPEHLLCEYSGNPRCRERLAEYFEVDGKMLCERHARMTRLISSGDEEDDDEQWAKTTKAMKRTTRFIDLTGRGKPR